MAFAALSHTFSCCSNFYPTFTSRSAKDNLHFSLGLPLSSQKHSKSKCVQLKVKGNFSIQNHKKHVQFRHGDADFGCEKHVQDENGYCQEASLSNDGKQESEPFIEALTASDASSISGLRKTWDGVSWFVAPMTLVASFVLPSIYLRRIIFKMFDDSLLTDSLVLFFTEVLFFCGAGTFLALINQKACPELGIFAANEKTMGPHFRSIKSLIPVLLTLTVPVMTIAVLWPWVGAAACATLAPYMVGNIIQFGFQYRARVHNSPSLPVIPIIFQVYRLHQLNRAAQLVSALSFTLREAEAGPHNMEISSSLGSLSNVIQFLGLHCIWSLSSYVFNLFTSIKVTKER